jgi:fatty-acyl-CoA synthase
VAIEEVATGRTVSYRELDARAGRACTLLARRGIGLAIGWHPLPQSPRLLGTPVCVRSCGAILAPLNWRMPAGELDLLIRDAEPGLLIYDEAFHQAAAALETQPPLLGLRITKQRRSACRSQANGARGRETWYCSTRPDDRPAKGSDLHVRNGGRQLLNITAATDCEKATRFQHSFRTSTPPESTFTHSCASDRGRLLLLESYDVDGWQACSPGPAPPSVRSALHLPGIDRPPAARLAPLAQVRHWGCGGAPLPDRLAERYRELGIRLCNGMA